MSTDTCSACDCAFEADELSVVCVECERCYHIGTCAGLTEKQYKNKAKQKWVCPTCKTAKRQGDKQDEKLVGDEIAGIRSLLVNMNAKLDDLMPLKETVTSIEKSVQLMSEKYDELLVRVATQEKDTKDIRKRLEILEQKVENKEEENEMLRSEMHDLEWRSRRLNLELHGVQPSENENLLDKVNAVADLVEISRLSTADVDAIHRLPAKADKIPGIIIRYARQAIRDEWLDKRHKLRELNSKIAILENMTSYNRQLLRTTKDWAKLKAYQYVWHRNGKIFVRKADGQSAIAVRNVRDLPP